MMYVYIISLRWSIPRDRRPAPVDQPADTFLQGRLGLEAEPLRGAPGIADPPRGQRARRRVGRSRHRPLGRHGNDGLDPEAGLVLDNRGALYGTTITGTVFKLTPPNWTENVLFNFTGGGDNGSWPCALIFRRGSLFGLSRLGGSPANTGTAFQCAVLPMLAVDGACTATTVAESNCRNRRCGG